VTSLARPNLDAIEQAASRIDGLARRTPFLPSAFLSGLTGAEVRLKLETLQTTGSFKFRGALNAVTRARERHPDLETVMTVSAGNHGLALATAAAQCGLRARVHLPATAPDAKRLALKQLGAEIVEAPTYDAAEDAAREEIAAGDHFFISPYADDDVIAGAGTVALEMLAEWPGLDLLIVPVGGGGLISGAAIVARESVDDVTVWGAEAEASPVFSSALAAGRPVTVDVRSTLADGLAGNMDPGSQTFGIVRDLVDRVVQVDEDAIARAMAGLAVRDGVVAEGAGAVGVAALDLLDLTDRRVGIVVSGRNVDAAVLQRVLASTSSAL
jgi:threonine dehydratase